MRKPKGIQIRDDYSHSGDIFEHLYHFPSPVDPVPILNDAPETSAPTGPSEMAQLYPSLDEDTTSLLPSFDAQDLPPSRPRI